MTKKLIELPMPIITPRLKIVPAHPDHAQKILDAKIESVDILHPWMVWIKDGPGTLEEQRIMLAMAYHKFLTREDLMMLAFTHDGAFVVATGLHQGNWDDGVMEIGYWAKKSAHGKGYVTEAANALTRYAFDVLGVRKIGIGMDSENTASEAVPKRLNMTLEFEAAGMIRTLHPKDGPLRVRRSYAAFDTSRLPALDVSW